VQFTCLSWFIIPFTHTHTHTLKWCFTNYSNLGAICMYILIWNCDYYLKLFDFLYKASVAFGYIGDKTNSISVSMLYMWSLFAEFCLLAWKGVVKGKSACTYNVPLPSNRIECQATILYKSVTTMTRMFVH